MNRVRDIEAHNVDFDTFTMADVESNMVRCPDQAAAQKMIDGGCMLLAAWQCWLGLLTVPSPVCLKLAWAVLGLLAMTSPVCDWAEQCWGC